MEKLDFNETQYSFDVFKKLTENNASGNTFFSPISISSAVKMTVLGAREKTADRLIRVLHFEGTADVHPNFQKRSAEINNKGESLNVLNVANQLFGEKTFNFLPDFISSIQNLYRADLGTVNFLSAAENARQDINKWVSEQTKGNIPELLIEGSVNGNTKLVLANAIYFKWDWAEKFNAQVTTEKPFRLSKNKQTVVKMMYQKKKLPFTHISEISCRILELPYADQKLSMIIILPDNIEDDTTGLQKIETELTLEKFQRWTKSENMRPIDVRVHLPKFKLEDSPELKPVLSTLGIEDLFTADAADLSGMSGSKDLVLSKVFHKAFLQVNEEGIEAATGGIANFCMLMEKDFKADHPFTFFIRHKPTNSIRFFNKEGTEAATAGISNFSMLMEEDFNADHPFIFFIRHNPANSILFFGRYVSP